MSRLKIAPLPRFYCHFQLFNEFLNELEQEIRQSNQDLILQLLTGLMNQRNPPPSTSAQHPQRTTAEPEDAMRDFMGQLLTNLIGNLGNRAGGAIHIEIGDENGGRYDGYIHFSLE